MFPQVVTSPTNPVPRECISNILAVNSTDDESSEGSLHSQLSGSEEIAGKDNEQVVHPDWMSGMSRPDVLSTDTILVSSDLVECYVHSQRLLGASVNGFNGKLPLPLSTIKMNDGVEHRNPYESHSILRLPEKGAILNIILLVAYGFKEKLLNHALALSFSDLLLVIPSLEMYGFPLQTSVSRSTPLFQAIVAFCPQSSFAVYCLGACYSYALHHVAQHASQYLLSLDLSTITDSMASDVGAVYLKHLFALQMFRTQEFKRLVVPPPRPHSPLSTCDSSRLSRTWDLGSALLTWVANAAVENSVIEAIVANMDAKMDCPSCEVALHDRGQDLINEWSLVRVSLHDHVSIHVLTHVCLLCRKQSNRGSPVGTCLLLFHGVAQVFPISTHCIYTKWCLSVSFLYMFSKLRAVFNNQSASAEQHRRRVCHESRVYCNSRQPKLIQQVSQTN